MISRLLRLSNPALGQRFVIQKRWSGHNAMEITPSNLDMKFTHNWLHFYVILAAVPAGVITTIINIRANPELSEVPEGYEPRHWEYQKHPIARFMARYFYNPEELEHEILMNFKQGLSQDEIKRQIGLKCEKVMQFYNDHRSINFIPFFAEYFRSGRDEANFRFMYEKSQPNQILDLAYDPSSKIVPTEGYSPDFNPADIK